MAKTFFQKSPDSAFINPLQRGLKNLYNTIIRQFMIIGEKCINDGRINGSNTDQSGCLRSSIGYVVIDNGRIVDLKCKGDSEEGRKQGGAFLRELAAKENRGIVIIVVAGMNYAKYVSAKGYNVLDSAEILADKLVKALVKKLSSKR
ncbi:MAG: hypothetical protein R3Y50_06015 [Rikenellaceae bacterium]